MPDPLTILYQDTEIVAVHKPAGLKMHRGAGDDRHQPFLLQVVRDQTGRRIYPIHRLDQPTSGIVLLAFNTQTAHALAEKFKQQQVTKTYLAVVRGIIDPMGSIDYPLTPNAAEPKAGQTPKPAITDYERLETIELPFATGQHATSRYSLASVRPRTGRMHQIRRHFHHISHPVIGDTIYGDGRHNRLFRQQYDCHRLLLAAVALQLIHPWTGLPLCIEAPLEDSFWKAICSLGWEVAIPGQWRADQGVGSM
ncbi:MAG: pseudouridine synthase [Desulfobacteraceae bacterium]|nr:pseudouridine synthase [Desulfobacteraceae bacterium]